MSPSESLTQRVVELESRITHLQRDLDQFNSVILEQQAEIKLLNTMIARLQGRLSELADPPESRNQLEELPPHY